MPRSRGNSRRGASIHALAERNSFKKGAPGISPGGRISARPPPDKRACRSPGGGCGPDSAPREARAEPDPMEEWCIQSESTPDWGAFALEAPPGIGPGMKVLQTSALPLGYGAGWRSYRGCGALNRGSAQNGSEKAGGSRLGDPPAFLERITGLEPATSTLARSRSTK